MVALGGGPSLLWYLTRGTGTAALIALGAALALGVANLGAWPASRLPAFVVDELHRYLAAVALLLLAVHILTAVLDPFAGIGIAAAILPGTTSYRPLWLGLGAVAFDLLALIYLSSRIRLLIPYPLWKRIHLLAWLAYPVALLHAFGSGSDVRFPWFLLAALCSLALVGLACLQRIATSRLSADLRLGLIGGFAVALLLFAIWAVQGPLAANWAKRAGTPAQLIGGGRR